MRLRKKSRSLRARSKQAGGGHNSRPRRTASRAAHAGKVVGYLATHALLVVPVELARAFRFRGLFMVAVAERLIPGQPAHADPFRLGAGIELERAGCGAFDDACHDTLLWIMARSRRQPSSPARCGARRDTDKAC